MGNDTDNPLIFWDGYGLDRANSGIYSHSHALSLELQKLGIRPVIIGKANCAKLFSGLNCIELPRAKWFQRLANSKVVWPNRVLHHLAMLLEKQESSNETIILHGLSNLNIPIDKNITKDFNLKRVITIHDLIPLLAPKSISRAYYRQFKYLLPRIMQTADKIVSVSRWTTEGLTHLFPSFAHKIVTIPNGFYEFDKEQKFSGELLKTGSTIKLLAVSRFESYKRLELLCNILYKKPHEFKAILVTDDHGVKWAHKNAPALIKLGSLRVVSNIDKNALKKLYRESNVFVHPSLYEGFCLPAAEALASGTPVVYTSGSALDETVGNLVGVPMNQSATIFDWITAIEYAANLKFTQKFHRDIGDHIEKAPKWDSSAKHLAKVYYSLV